MNKFVKFNADCGEFKAGDTVEMDAKTAETLCKAGICAETDNPEKDTEDKVEKAVSKQLDKAVAELTKSINKVESKLPAVAKAHNDESLGDFIYCVGKTASNNNGDVRTKAHNKLREAYKTTMSEGTNSAGGYTVPVEYGKELLFVPGYEGTVYPGRINTRPMGSKSLVLPALDQTVTPSGGSSAFYAGVNIGIVAEGTAPSDNTQPAFKQVVLTAKKCLATAVVSNELLDDSIISVENLIKSQFSMASTWFINNRIFNGAGGSSDLTGVIDNGATIAVNRAGSNAVVLADLGAMYSRLAPDSRKNAVWYINPLVWQQLVQLGSSGGAAAHFVWIGNDAQGAVGNRLFGLEVVPTEALPVLGQPADVVLMDARYYALGMRTEMTIDASPHYLFPADQLTYRLKFRLDGTPQITAPIKLAAGGSNNTVSPFVQLDVVAS